MEKKIDKRSKEYKNNQKTVSASKQQLIEELGAIAVVPTLTSTAKDLQKQIDKLSARILQLENKVG